MKLQTTKGLLIACCMMLVATGYAQKGNTPAGHWTYSAPDAPFEYQNGKIEFKQQGGKLVAIFKIGTETFPAIEVAKKDNQYTCNLSIEGNDVAINLKPDGENLKGIASLSGGWELPVTLKPVKKE